MIIDEFLNYLKYEKRRSLLTVESYSEDLKAFQSYFTNLDSQLSWETITANDIRSWMESMMDKGNTATTINRRLSALRSFYRFARLRLAFEKDPAKNVTGPKKQKLLPQFLKEVEMERLLDDVLQGDDFESIRDRAIIALFYETGVRLSELTALNCSDIDFVQRQIKVTGKRNKQRIIPFGDKLNLELRAYIIIRGERANIVDDALFVSNKGCRMLSTTIRRRVEYYISQVSTLKKRSPHVLRHTFATAMLNNDADIESVRHLLGHESLKTTEVYTHTTFEHLKRVYSKAHPRAGLKK